MQIIYIIISILFGAHAVDLSASVLSREPVQFSVAQHNTASMSTQKEVISQRSLSLSNRHAAETINDVFRKNILLNLAYLNGSVTEKHQINWEDVQSPQEFQITLNPGETFAYHDDVLQQYEPSVVSTTNSHFNAQEGYLSSGFLFGDGVCHLASIINWAAQDAGLDVTVTKLHSIAPIPDVPDEYGVSIYTIAGVAGSGANNNLYITNNKSVPVSFVFTYDSSDRVVVSVAQLS